MGETNIISLFIGSHLGFQQLHWSEEKKKTLLNSVSSFHFEALILTLIHKTHTHIVYHMALNELTHFSNHSAEGRNLYLCRNIQRVSELFMYFRIRHVYRRKEFLVHSYVLNNPKYLRRNKTMLWNFACCFPLSLLTTLFIRFALSGSSQSEWRCERWRHSIFDSHTHILATNYVIYSTSRI